MDEPSCDAMQNVPLAREPDVLAKLKQFSSAEDFFQGLGVAYEPRKLAVVRLHILKRMGEYLASDDLDGLPDSMVVARCRVHLERAYADFLTSSPLDERVFKVLKDAVAPREKAFVPLDELK